MFVFPLFPYTAPPTEAATSPNEQNTDANPAAKAKVGSVVALSFRSPAAFEMYEMVNGKSPQTQGEIEVSKPAPYITGIDDRRFDGSPWRLVEAMLFAAF